MRISDGHTRGISQFGIFTAVLAVLAITGAALSVASVVHAYRQVNGVNADNFYLVSLGTLGVIVGLSVVSWTRRRAELRQRRTVESTLRESEQKYRALVENAPVGIVISSFDGVVIDVNETLVRMHGYDSKEEFLKSKVSDRFEDLRERDRWVGVVWDTGKVEGFEARSKRKDGSLFWTSTTAIPRTAESSEQQIVAVVQDISKRKEAEEALRSSESRYSSLFTHMMEGFAYCRMIFQNGKPCDFEYLDVNRRFQELTGLKNATGRKVSELIPGLRESNPELFEAYGRVASTGQPEKIETYLPALDSWFSISVYSPKKEHFVAVFDVITQRKKDEATLAESEAKFRILAEQSPNMIFINQDGRVVYANKRCSEIMGYSPEEFHSPDFDFLSLVKETSRDAVMANFQSHKEGREVAPYEYALVSKDGVDIDCILTSRIVDFEGRPAILGTVTDITRRKRAERTMAFKNALLEAQSESTEDGILVVDENDKIVLHNRRFCELWGIPPELLNPGEESPALKRVLPQVKDPEAFMDRLNYLRAHKDERSSDQIELKNGRVFERYSSPLVEVNGTYRGRVRYFRDVTEARNARKNLELAAQEWRRTFDSIPDAVSIQDADFRLVRVNRAYARMVKKQPEELLGKKCYEVVHQCSCPVDRCPHKRTLETGELRSEELFEPSLGAYLEVTTSPICDENGKVVGSVHVAHDTTSRREMQEQLLLADRLSSIGELVSGVAHELNNPLTGVIGFSELLMEKDLNEDVKKEIDIICGEARRAARIVRDLVTFAGQHSPIKQVCQLNYVIDDVLRLRAYQQSVNNIQVVRHTSVDLPQIMADYFQIQQVFLNIIINAEYFMTEAHHRGTLTVTTERIDGFVRASFGDDGPGIKPETIGRVFNPFFTTKETGKGTGLGLSVSHGIVAEHGGRIYATSQPGRGATFVVELPLEQDADRCLLTAGVGPMLLEAPGSSASRDGVPHPKYGDEARL